MQNQQFYPTMIDHHASFSKEIKTQSYYTQETNFGCGQLRHGRGVSCVAGTIMRNGGGKIERAEAHAAGPRQQQSHAASLHVLICSCAIADLLPIM
jgi:hypothetical protein